MGSSVPLAQVSAQDSFERFQFRMGRGSQSANARSNEGLRPESSTALSGHESVRPASAMVASRGGLRPASAIVAGPSNSSVAGHGGKAAALRPSSAFARSATATASSAAASSAMRPPSPVSRFSSDRSSGSAAAVTPPPEATMLQQRPSEAATMSPTAPLVAAIPDHRAGSWSFDTLRPQTAPCLSSMAEEESTPTPRVMAASLSTDPSGAFRGLGGYSAPSSYRVPSSTYISGAPLGHGEAGAASLSVPGTPGSYSAHGSYRVPTSACGRSAGQRGGGGGGRPLSGGAACSLLTGGWGGGTFRAGPAVSALLSSSGAPQQQRGATAATQPAQRAMRPASAAVLSDQGAAAPPVTTGAGCSPQQRPSSCSVRGIYGSSGDERKKAAGVQAGLGGVPMGGGSLRRQQQPGSDNDSVIYTFQPSDNVVVVNGLGLAASAAPRPASASLSSSLQQPLRSRYAAATAAAASSAAASNTHVAAAAGTSHAGLVSFGAGRSSLY